MKRFFTTSIFMVALAIAGSASAQSSAVSPAVRDSVLLRQATDGDYQVRTYRVTTAADADYLVRYRINLATVNTSFEQNARQLDDLTALLDSLRRDASVRIERARITGYASPDGPVTFNDSLAAERARNFRTYLDNRYNLSNRFDVGMESVAEDWQMCRQLVAESSIPDRERVLEIIDSNRSPQDKEFALKAIPAAWEYMKINILPPLRRAEFTLDYAVNSVVEQREYAPVVTQEPEPQKECPCQCVIIDESITGMMVEVPEEEVWREIRAERHINREIDRAARRAARQELKAMRQAERELRRTAR